jgi:hypothetical protein
MTGYPSEVLHFSLHDLTHAYKSSLCSHSCAPLTPVQFLYHSHHQANMCAVTCFIIPADFTAD